MADYTTVPLEIWNPHEKVLVEFEKYLKEINEIASNISEDDTPPYMILEKLRELKKQYL